jgi:hypothetical protein
MRRVILATFVAALVSILGIPRVFCADLAGTVVDTQRRPVANVKIVVMNPDNKVVSRAQSNSSGRYQVTGLASGKYKYVLDAAGSGFKGGDAVSYLGPQGLTIDWYVSQSGEATAFASNGAGTMLASDPYGFSSQEFTGIVLGSVVLVGGAVVGGLAAAGEFSGSSSSPPPTSPSL